MKTEPDAQTEELVEVTIDVMGQPTLMRAPKSFAVVMSATLSANNSKKRTNND